MVLGTGQNVITIAQTESGPAPESACRSSTPVIGALVTASKAVVADASTTRSARSGVVPTTSGPSVVDSVRVTLSPL